MLHKKANAALGVVLALVGSSVTATGPRPGKPIACAMVNGSKIRPASIRAAEVCSSIQTAVRKRVPTASFSVRIVALSASMLVATVRMDDGRVLPEQNLRVSDGVLDQRSVSRLAAAIATQVADAVRS